MNEGRRVSQCYNRRVPTSLNYDSLEVRAEREGRKVRGGGGVKGGAVGG